LDPYSFQAIVCQFFFSFLWLIEHNQLDNAITYGVIIFTDYMLKLSGDPKLQSLREQGCLNPRPQSVTDELFTGNEFFDSRDMAQVKYEMLRRVERDGHSISDAAMGFGFSRPTFYQAQAAFEAGGVAGLVPRKRGPKQAHKLTTEVIEFIERVRQEDPSLRTQDLVDLIRERFDLVVHPRTIERGLARSQKKR
jgi:transposase